MDVYYMNAGPFMDGDRAMHMVHRAGCRFLPVPSRRVVLGTFLDCRGAMAHGEQRGYAVYGCYFCCPKCVDQGPRRRGEPTR